MPTVVLVRHGQASWGDGDYDRLSSLGAQQSESTGQLLAGLTSPDVLISGGLTRHLSTAEAVVAAAGWDLPVQVDPGWNEFDHLQVLNAYGVQPPNEESEEFLSWLHSALARWTDGESDADYDEPFAGFTSRVDVALRRLHESMDPAGTAVVFTSLGPICWTVAAMLGGQPHVWLRLVPVVVNAGVTRISFDARGMHLSTFNEHAHLGAEMLTFR